MAVLANVKVWVGADVSNPALPPAIVKPELKTGVVLNVFIPVMVSAPALWTAVVSIPPPVAGVVQVMALLPPPCEVNTWPAVPAVVGKLKL